MNTVTQTFKQIGFFTIALTLALVANFAYGQWVNPTEAPTGGNIAAPINESSRYQEKAGDVAAADIISVTRMRSDIYCDRAGVECVSMNDIYNIVNNPGTPPPAPSTQSCMRDGVTVAHGDTRVFYTRTSSSNCSAYADTLTCSDGTLSGSSVYQYATCSAPPPVLRSCTLGGVTVPHGGSHRFYLQPVALNCEFRSDLRTCNDGTFNGNQNYGVADCRWGSIAY